METSTKTFKNVTPKLVQVKVLKRLDTTQELLKMWIERPPGFTFKAGQYCTLGIDGIERAYSIVSAPYESDLELFVELVPLAQGGVLTPKIWELREGDSISIRPRAKGIFVFKPEKPKHLMVATVTGVAPYISIVRQYLHDRQSGHRFYILQGASYHDELTYDGELAGYAMQHPDVVAYVPTLSRPGEKRNNGWAGATGRANALVEKYAETFACAPEDTIVYACGHPGMIEDVKARMLPKGYQVVEERFWKED
ncbi:MAG: ferredoxin--NADP reductase [SAR202 cluster bacterium]|nr:ferredoxin--NADP reductase [SAR202 cluster bacterium]